MTGVALTLCTKNDEELVKSAFRERCADMALCLDDFAAIRANWGDKPENIEDIAREIGLGAEHFVFIDDNPVECARVRQALPEAAVICLPPDAADFPRAVDRHCFFERAVLTEADLGRGGHFSADRQRREFRSHSSTLSAYLENLEMKIAVANVDESLLDRCSQLISKSNQFNLTTRRHSSSHLRKMCADPSWAVHLYRLSDRFGDNGWIGAMILHDDGSRVEIDSWILSCRVLGREVERFMLARACDWTRNRNREFLTTCYVPTAKNRMVQDLCDRLGFQAAPGSHRYSMKVPDSGPEYPAFFFEEGGGGQHSDHTSKMRMGR